MMFNGTLITQGRLLGNLWLCAAIMAVTQGTPAAQESFPEMPTYDIFTDQELQRDFLRLEYKAPLAPLRAPEKEVWPYSYSLSLSNIPKTSGFFSFFVLARSRAEAPPQIRA